MARKSRAGKQTAARERARLARHQVEAERDKRDHQIEEAATEYFIALDEHETIAKKYVSPVARRLASIELD